MTFDDIRKIALAWPEVEDGTSYGTPALKVRKKMLARLREDHDSLVVPGVALDEREMLIERALLLNEQVDLFGADAAVHSLQVFEPPYFIVELTGHFFPGLGHDLR